MKLVGTASAKKELIVKMSREEFFALLSEQAINQIFEIAKHHAIELNPTTSKVKNHEA